MRLFELFLLEDKIPHIAKQLGDKLSAALEKDTFADSKLKPEQILMQLAKADPSGKQKYLQWLANRYVQQDFRLEDLGRVKQALELFMKKQKGLDKKDINQYKSLNDLEDAVEDAEEVKSKRQQKQEIKTDGAEVIHKEASYAIYKMKTKEAACYYGKGTKWCTAADDDEQNMFSYYDREGPLYVLINDEGRKVQFHWESDSFMNEKDQPLDKDYLANLYPAMVKTVPKKPVPMFNWAYEVVKGRFPEGEKYIAQEPFTAFSYALLIKEPFPAGEDAIAQDAEYSMSYAEEVLKGRFPKGEPRIMLSNNERPVAYARDIIKGPWPEAEPHIAKSVWSSVAYARQVLDGRFPEAEDHIMKHSPANIDYAEHAIKGRWKEAEPYIMEDYTMAGQYLRRVVKGPWPEFNDHLIEKIKKDPEDAGLNDTWYTYKDTFDPTRSKEYEAMGVKGQIPIRFFSMYIRDIVKERVPEIEKYILQKPGLVLSYAVKVLGGRWPEGEKAMLNFHNPHKLPGILYRYAKIVIDGPWPEAEEIIKLNPGTWDMYQENILDTE